MKTTTEQKPLKFNVKCSKMVFDEYGKVLVIPTKPLGIILDLIIPFTFGLITLGLIKLFGKELRI